MSRTLWPRERVSSLAPLAGGAALAALLGILAGRGHSSTVLVLSVGGLLALLTGLRFSRLLVFPFFLALLVPVVFPGKVTDLLLAVAEGGLAAAVVIASRRRLDIWPLWVASALGILLWFASTRSLAAGDAPLNPTHGFVSVTAQAMLLAAGASRTSRDDEIREFGLLACLAGIALACWGVAEYVLNRGLVFHLVNGVRRPVGPFGNPNYFGAALALVGVLAMALVRLQWKERRPIWFPLLTAGVASLAMMTTLSRGAFAGFSLGAALVVSRGLSPQKRRVFWVVTALAALAVVPFAWRQIETDRIAITPGTTAQARQLLSVSLRARYLAFRLGLDYAAANPWTGVGLDRFPVLAENDPRLGIFMNTHQEPIRIAAEAGIPALVLLGLVGWRAIQRVRSRSASVRDFVLPVAAAYGLMNLFLNGLEFVVLSYPCIILVFLASGSPLETHAEDSPDAPARDSLPNPPLMVRAR